MKKTSNNSGTNRDNFLRILERNLQDYQRYTNRTSWTLTTRQAVVNSMVEMPSLISFEMVADYLGITLAQLRYRLGID